MPLTWIASSLRAALSDMTDALRCGRMEDARGFRDQMLELIGELDEHGEAKEKVAAND